MIARQHNTPRVLRIVGASIILLTLMTACRGADGPMGPAGAKGDDGDPRTDLFLAKGTGSLIVNEMSDQFAPLPGLRTVVTVPPNGSSALLIGTDGGIQIASDNPLGTCIVDVAIAVDGVPLDAGRRIVVSNTPSVLYSVNTYALTAVTAVTAGTHNITVVARQYGHIITNCYVSGGVDASPLPGAPHLQGTMNTLVFR